MTSFQFTETMAGSYRLVDRPDDERPMSFTIRARAPSLRRLLSAREVEIEGEVDAEDFADHRRLRGTLRLDVFTTRRLPYEFEFEANDGRQCRFAGTKKVLLGELLRTMTTLPGKIFDDTGREVALAELRFDLRGDLARFLRSWRWVRP